MKLLKVGALLAIATALPLTGVQAAAVRPTMVSVPVAANTAALPAGARVGTRMAAKKNSLLGAPLFLVFLGAVTITIGTIIVTNNNGSSPG